MEGFRALGFLGFRLMVGMPPGQFAVVWLRSGDFHHFTLHQPTRHDRSPSARAHTHTQRHSQLS